ncbi:DUF2283 domain-containing protein [Skermanella rosea]|uniref:DUF2283 domain-containing protein n=1 Tax=Skermanella rosea TaxID=1817965 RepID=UPI00193417B0|nr:DUF2283 domain-containing protein [Skermanella rosea]UEM03515.1 DUF2283 domain-containing protein [Skermanella rosea]
MKITYDPSTDTLSVVLRDAVVVESDEDKPGITLDYDGTGALVAVEILDASKNIEDVSSVEFKVAV